MASSAVLDSTTALTNSHGSFKARMSTLGASGAFGPLKIQRPVLWTPTILVDGLLRSFGNLFNPWSTLAAMSPTSQVWKFPSLVLARNPFQGLITESPALQRALNLTLRRVSTSLLAATLLSSNRITAQRLK